MELPPRVECAIHEYESVRNEIIQRTSSNHAFMAWSIVAIGGIAWFSEKLDYGPLIAWTALVPSWMMLSLVILDVQWTHTERLGNYVAWLEHKIELLLLPEQPPETVCEGARIEAARYHNGAPSVLRSALGWERWIRRPHVSRVGANRLHRVIFMIVLDIIAAVVAAVEWNYSTSVANWPRWLLIVFPIGSVALLAGLILGLYHLWAKQTLARLPNARIEGLVSQNEHGVHNARVRVMIGHEEFETRSDKEGRYNIVIPIGPAEIIAEVILKRNALSSEQVGLATEVITLPSALSAGHVERSESSIQKVELEPNKCESFELKLS
jgi:hypothetical protein